MSTRAINGIAGTEPIPGYILRKRIGAGGYGEVWLADAPGGLRKAVKLIYGQVDEKRANCELKSLERIRRAYHPFLLSIERVEVVQGKVIVVTELAEGSLQNRFESYRRQGAPGIPRAELLEFLRDAADALDFLAQKHSLQHLDVKPGNLLVVADRIKVGDFGLLKDLKDKNQSIVGGLTPTYSAPELFDGQPNFRSDQYSLAIVYMEMLTGKMPFRGTSAGELARQHLTMPPNLEALPPADRSIVMRALAKSPKDRYATCRQFIDQLVKSRSILLPQAVEPKKNLSSSGDSQTKTQTSELATQLSPSKDNFFHSSIPLQDLASQWVQSRCLFIGIGGQGIHALQELRNDLDSNVDARFCLDDHQWLAIDTDCEGWTQSTDREISTQMISDCIFHLPIRTPHHYRKYPIEKFGSLSRRWLYNIPRSLKTEGVRPIATLSLLENYEDLRSVIEKKIEVLIGEHLNERQGDSPLRVYCLCSLHGGTGSALLAEIGMMVRDVMQSFSFDDYRISATIGAATASSGSNGPNLPVANAIATLSELSYWMDPTREKANIYSASGASSSNTCPFDWVTLVEGGFLNDPKSCDGSAKDLARYVSLDCQSLLFAALSNSRLNAKDVSQHGWLRNGATTSIQGMTDFSLESIAKWCSVKALWEMLCYFDSPSIDRMVLEEDDSIPRSLESKYIPLTEEACVTFRDQFLKDIGISLMIDGDLPSEAWINQWSSRISDDCSLRQSQLLSDLSKWQHILDEMIGQRAIGWSIVQRIQEMFSETLRRFHVEQNIELLNFLLRRHKIELSVDDLQQRVLAYMLELTESSKRIFSVVRQQAEAMGKQYRQSWQKVTGDTRQVQLAKTDLTSLPESIRQAASTTRSRLESGSADALRNTLERELCHFRSCDSSTPEKKDFGSNESSGMISFSKMLVSASDIIVSLCDELGFSSDVFSVGDYHYQSIPMDSLADFIPPLCSGGGEIFRIVISPEKLIPRISEAVDALGLRAQTTLLPGTDCQGTQVICDLAHLNIPFLISSLWRPSGPTLDLAERLRTRIDIDWEPVSALLVGHRTHLSFETSPPVNAEQSNSDPAVPTQNSEFPLPDAACVM